MTALRSVFLSLSVSLIVALVLPHSALAATTADLQRGKYLFNVSGCVGCHTDKGGETLAGGRKLVTPFGSFYTPNITSDQQTGIGNWSDRDFLRALRMGISPQKTYYFPAFPFTSFSKLSDQDILAIKAYIWTLKPVKKTQS